ncbi:MAG TPA: TIGR02186 family protein [Methyloceanibacter sp.]|nr:TIGR02186 family protein [Methyloceanibacter sp.]
MMRTLLTLVAILLGLAMATAHAAGPPPSDEVVSDISTREIAIKSNFAGIEILIFGSIDFSARPAPETGAYDVVVVIRAPGQAIVARRKQRMAGIWVNGPGVTYPDVPGFYAVLSTRPLRAITSEETLKSLGVGLGNLDFGRSSTNDANEQSFRSAVIDLKERQMLFQEDDGGVAFIGRSLFRTSVDLPANVPIGRYTADVYLFRDGQAISENHSTLKVNKVGFEQAVYLLAFRHSFIYGLIAVVIAVIAGLIGWVAFRRE